MAGKNRTKMDLEAHMDRGWAWVILAGCSIGQMLTPGMFWSFGIFLLAWGEQLSDSVTDLQWILSLLLAFAHLAGKFTWWAGGESKWHKEINKRNLSFTLYHFNIHMEGGTQILKQTGMCRSNGSLCYKKSLNMGSVLYKKKKNP